MRKAVAISFLLLANIIILAHAVIPHHHHDRMVVSVFVTHSDSEKPHSHTKDNDHHHDRNHEKDTHKHEGGSENEDCALYTVYNRPDNNTVKITSPVNCDYGQILYFIISSVANTSNLDDDVGLPFRQTPYLIAYDSILATHSFGMRAPPAC